MTLSDNLNGIVRNGEIVFLDTSLMDIEAYKIGSFPSLQNLDTEMLQLQQKSINDFLKILGNPSTRTTPEVTAEIEYSARRMEKEVEKLSLPKDRCKPKYQENKAILDQMIQEIDFCEEESARKEFNPGNKALYRSLVEMVKSLSIGLRLCRRFGQPKSSETGLYTTEKLIASAYFASLCKKSPILLTRDTYFPTLLGVTPKLMGSDVFLPCNKDFRAALLENPFKLYLYFDGKLKGPEFENMDLSYPTDFSLRNTDAETADRLRGELEQYWKLFCGARGQGYSIAKRNHQSQNSKR